MFTLLMTSKRSERFNDPKKQLTKKIYDLVVISYQVRMFTLKTYLHHSGNKENLNKAGEKN